MFGGAIQLKDTIQNKRLRQRACVLLCVLFAMLVPVIGCGMTQSDNSVQAYSQRDIEMQTKAAGSFSQQEEVAAPTPIKTKTSEAMVTASPTPEDSKTPETKVPSTKSPEKTKAPETKAPSTKSPEKTKAPETDKPGSSSGQGDSSSKTSYVVNTNTKKFHYPNCSSVKDIKDSNRWDFRGKREELIEKGYVPCKKCKP